MIQPHGCLCGIYGDKVGNEMAFYPSTSVSTVNSHFARGTLSHMSPGRCARYGAQFNRDTVYIPPPHPAKQKMFAPHEERQGFTLERNSRENCIEYI
jgi:hypothetical protein